MNAKPQDKERKPMTEEAVDDAEFAEDAEFFEDAETNGMRRKSGTTESEATAGDDPDEEALNGEILEGAEEGEAERDDKEAIQNRYLRLNADFDNFRKRTQKEKEDWSRYASQRIVEKLLPVIDNLDAAAIAVANAGEESRNVADGYLMIHKQLTDILSHEGLTEIPALDKSFDPNVHEAVMTVSLAEGQAENQVVVVLRKGYMFKDKVLRPAMVQVAKST
ncbi:MAG: nucleotide exchange factor GrpE [Clostridiales bacterium]|nr:nucleotide exchange factor GrpE [Clostridiales bacterium]